MVSLNRGKFITFEGGEGSGKTTQIRLLTQAFKNAAYPVIQTREPGGTESAEVIRKLLVTPQAFDWEPTTELLLHLAARVEHVQKWITPNLEQGCHVLCDRFFDSTVAYQAMGHQLGIPFVEKFHHLLFALEPDLTLFLSLDLKEGLKRAEQRLATTHHAENRYEQMPSQFHQRVHHGFDIIASRSPLRCHKLAANRSIREVHQDIIRIVTDYTGLPLTPLTPEAVIELTK